MSPSLRRSIGRLALASAGLASVESAGFYLFWWWRVIAGGLQGPDFFAFYAAARLFLARGGDALYVLPAQAEFQAQVTAQWGPGPFTLLPYIHPPQFILLIAPLGWLPYRSAYLIWAGMNLGLAAVATALLARSGRLGRTQTVFAAVCLAGFLPLFITLLQGQSDLLILTLLAGSFAAWAAGREGAAGVLAALAMIKPQLLLLVPVLFLARRSWRALAGFAGTGAALFAIALIAVGPTAVRDYLGIVLGWLVRGHAGWPIAAQSAYSLRGLFEGLPLGRGLSLFALAVLALAAMAALWRGKAQPRLDFALAVAASVSLSPYLNLHDLVLLAVPVFAVGSLALDGRLHRPALGIAAILMVAVGTEVTLLAGSWTALVGVLALAAFLVGERLNADEQPLAIAEVGDHGSVQNQASNLEKRHPMDHLPDLIGDQ